MAKTLKRSQEIELAKIYIDCVLSIEDSILLDLEKLKFEVECKKNDYDFNHYKRLFNFLEKHYPSYKNDEVKKTETIINFLELDLPKHLGDIVVDFESSEAIF